MNKMKRIFSLVLAFAIMLGTFGSFAPVFAAEEGATADSEVLRKVPEDVIGTEHEDAIRRLVAFGIIGGYPDGTYKPENVVNRAQFSKIIVEALGLRDAVPAATGQGTAFSDVKGDYWAAGYINVASGQGLLKGYPDGTFRPAKEVKYSEALTMLVRALGYKDEFLSGEWPGNYVAKAADRGITSGVKIPTNANEGAQRGFVAQLVNNTLDAEIVTPKKYTGGLTAVEFEDTEITLLKDKLNISKHEDTRITEDKIINDGLRVEEAKVKFLQETKNVESVRKTYAKDDKTESHDFRITNKFNVRPFIGEEVSTYLTDKDEIIYVERENDDRANFDYVSEIKKDDELKLVKFDREYKFDKDADIFVFNDSDDRYDYYEGEDLTVSKIKDLKLAGKVGKFVVRNNRIVFAEIMESTEANPWFVVLKNDKGVLEGINKEAEDYKLDLTKDGSYDGALIFDVEGNELSANDIEKGDVLYVQAQDYDGDDYVYVVAVQDNKTTGKVGRFREDRVEIDDKFVQVINHKVDDNTFYDSYYSIDTLEDIKQWKESDWENDFDDANKEEVTIYKDAVGRIAFLSTDVETSSGYKFGVVTRTYADGDRVRIFTTIDGKEGKDQIFKADKESDIENAKLLDSEGLYPKDRTVTEEKILGQPVKFRLNKDGEIDKGEFYVMPAGQFKTMTGDFSKDIARLSGQNYAVNTNIDIIDAYGLDSEKIINALGADNKPGNLDGMAGAISGKKIDIDDFDVAKWEDMKGTKKDDDIKVYVFPRKDKAKEAEGMVFVGKVGANTGTDKEAVYVRDRWRDGDDIKVEYMAYGSDKTETRIVDGETSLSAIDRRSPYVGEIRSNGKIKLERVKANSDEKVEDTRNNTSFKFYNGEVEEITGSKLTLKGVTGAKNLIISNSAVVYDGGDKKSTSNIRKGENVLIIVQDDVRVRIVQLDVGKSDGETTPGVTADKELQMIHKDDKIIRIDGKTYKLDELVELYVKDGNSEKFVTSGITSITTEITKPVNGKPQYIGADVTFRVNKDGKVDKIVIVKTAAEMEAETNKKAADAVTKLIEALPGTVDLTNASAVKAAKAAFDKLTTDQKDLVLTANQTKLNNAVATIEALETAGAEKVKVDAALDKAKQVIDGKTLTINTTNTTRQAAVQAELENALSGAEVALVNVQSITGNTPEKDIEVTIEAADTTVTDKTVTAEVTFEKVISITALQGVTVPVVGEVKVTSITEETEFTGTVEWTGPIDADGKFEAGTHTATITIVPKEGYVLTGADDFTVAGATNVTNAVNKVTAVFPPIS